MYSAGAGVKHGARLRWVLAWWWSRLPRSPRRQGVLAWLYLFWRERFTPGGRVLGAVWLFAVFLEALPGLSGIWPLLALLTAAFGVAWVSTLRSPRGKVLLLPPASVTEGETAFVHLVPEGILPGCHGGVAVLRDGLEAQESSSSLPWVVPIRTKFPGCYTIERAVLLRSDALGLLRARKRCVAAQELVVHVRPILVRSMSFLWSGAAGAQLRQALGNAAGRQGDFVGVRPWRDGDALRDLHHQAFARYGKPFVREYAPPAGNGITLMFLTGNARLRSAFLRDQARRLCAGVAEYLFRQGLLVGFAIDGVLVADNGPALLLRIQDALARVPWYGDVPKPEGRPVADLPGPVLAVGPWQAEANSLQDIAVKTLLVSAAPKSNGITDSQQSVRVLDWMEVEQALRSGSGCAL